MSDLITRLEALTGPCREIDSLIAKHLSPNLDWVAFEENGVDIWWSRCPYEDGAFDGPKPYTASIDAAMTLADGVRCRLIIAEDGISDVLVDGTQGCGHNTAIAICIAVLKSRKFS